MPAAIKGVLQKATKETKGPRSAARFAPCFVVFVTFPRPGGLRTEGCSNLLRKSVSGFKRGFTSDRPAHRADGAALLRRKPTPSPSSIVHFLTSFHLRPNSVCLLKSRWRGSAPTKTSSRRLVVGAQTRLRDFSHEPVVSKLDSLGTSLAREGLQYPASGIQHPASSIPKHRLTMASSWTGLRRVSFP
jgi:hypothetical protein